MGCGTKSVNHGLNDSPFSENGKNLFFSTFDILEDHLVYYLTALDKFS